MHYEIFATSRSGHNFILDFLKSCGINVAGKEENPLKHVMNRDNSIVVIRDYLNTVASLSIINVKHTNRSISSYKAIIKLCLLGNVHPYVIIYDKFVKDTIYRIHVVDDLGGTYTDDRLNCMANGGMHSSFDWNGDKHNPKNTYQNNAQEMRVTERWKQILDTPSKDLFIQNLQRDKEIIKMYLEYFEVDSEKNEFLKEYDLI